MRLYKGPKQNFISSFHFPINCLAHTAPKRKRKNCTENPFCIHRLGLELLDKLSESLKAPKVLVRRDSSRQPCGLTNAGNFCYVNNFFQTWFNDLKFRQCIYNWRPSENWTKPPTARLDIEATMNCLQQLFITMQFTPFESTDAGAFIELLRLDDRQQDTDPGRHSAFSESHQPDNFLCKLQSDERDGRRRSRTANRLISAIQSFFAPEPLTDYRCEQCELRGRVTRTANFTQLPEVLIIQLTRYVVGSFQQWSCSETAACRSISAHFGRPRFATGRRWCCGLQAVQVPANNHDAPLILHVQEQDGGEDEDEQNAGTTGGGFGHTALS
uniref:ubiquitinyl hydrolase 1 n=1 Tax=Globodera rostochiensis TaxID=31243 RepID=A0A914I6G9_GLORO